MLNSDQLIVKQLFVWPIIGELPIILLQSIDWQQFRLERSDAWGEAMPHYQRIKIRCCDMGGGYASLFGGNRFLITSDSSPIKSNCYRIISDSNR